MINLPTRPKRAAQTTVDVLRAEATGAPAASYAPISFPGRFTENAREPFRQTSQVNGDHLHAQDRGAPAALYAPLSFPDHLTENFPGPFQKTTQTTGSHLRAFYPGAPTSSYAPTYFPSHLVENTPGYYHGPIHANGNDLLLGTAGAPASQYAPISFPSRPTENALPPYCPPMPAEMYALRPTIAGAPAPRVGMISTYPSRQIGNVRAQDYQAPRYSPIAIPMQYQDDGDISTDNSYESESSSTESEVDYKIPLLAHVLELDCRRPRSLTPEQELLLQNATDNERFAAGIWARDNQKECRGHLDSEIRMEMWAHPERLRLQGEHCSDYSDNDSEPEVKPELEPREGQVKRRRLE